MAILIVAGFQSLFDIFILEFLSALFAKANFGCIPLGRINFYALNGTPISFAKITSLTHRPSLRNKDEALTVKGADTEGKR